MSFARKKTKALAFVRFGSEVEGILQKLPASGPLFPYLRRVRAGDRSTEFKQRCDGLGIKGVSLHCYRWAERARIAGMPERFAQETLGHNGKAVHRSYARKAKVVVPALEAYEQANVEKKVVSLTLSAVCIRGTDDQPCAQEM